MGQKISIDKYVSSLTEILSMNPSIFSNVQFDNELPDSIAQHVKIWKFYQSLENLTIKDEPISLFNVQEKGFSFQSVECYLSQNIINESPQFLPQSMWGIVESYSNLTPRGLAAPISTSEELRDLNLHILESFLMPKKQISNSRDSNRVFEYMIFVWNGNKADPLVKSICLSKAFELENLISQGKNNFLRVLFSGGVFNNQKLNKGTIINLFHTEKSYSHCKYILSSIQFKCQLEKIEDMDNIRDKIYLLKFLFPIVNNKQDKTKQDQNELIQKRRGRQFKHLKNLLSNIKDKKNDQHISKINMQKNNQQISLQNSKKNKVPLLNLGKNQTPPIELFEDNNESKSSLNSSLDLHMAVEMKQLNTSQENFFVKDNQQDIIEDQYFQDQIDNKKKIPNINLGKMSIDIKKIPMKQQQSVSITYPQIKEMRLQGIDIPLSENYVRQIKLDYFSKLCNEVYPNLLYVSGDQVAQNSQQLKATGINTIINCAGNVLKNYFPQEFSYTTFFLKDAVSENIECLFYQCIQIIEQNAMKNQKVLVHCSQGVSRSIAICMAYLIFKNKLDYNEAFEKIKKQREIANPNTGFSYQLMIFYKRLYEDYNKLLEALKPKVFVISTHQIEDPAFIVSRMMLGDVQLYTNKGNSIYVLDNRTIFVIQSIDKLQVWIGSECTGKRKELYIQQAKFCIENLQQYEHACETVEWINENNEPNDFWQLFGLQQKPSFDKSQNKEWDNWFIDPLQAPQKIEYCSYEQQNVVILNSDAPQDNKNVDKNNLITSRNQYIAPRIFIFPHCENSYDYYNLEDLKMEDYIAICSQSDDGEQKIIQWKGIHFQTSSFDNSVRMKLILQMVQQKIIGEKALILMKSRFTKKQLQILQFNIQTISL